MRGWTPAQRTWLQVTGNLVASKTPGSHNAARLPRACGRPLSQGSARMPNVGTQVLSVNHQLRVHPQGVGKAVEDVGKRGPS